jgi:hypothetical protein
VWAPSHERDRVSGRTLTGGMGRATRRLTVGALVLGAALAGAAASTAGVPAGAAGTVSTQTDLLLYSRPKSKHVTWTSTTPIIMVANVIKPRAVKTRLTGTVTFTVDGVKTTLPIKGLHHSNLKFLHGLSTGSHQARARYNGDATFAPSVSPPRVFTIS